ncbi:hypothetical protein GGS23DRAFT_167051 [Durotheca rogersii]|uniref:uncharacterized protein n=1 Tax=Durotheca rogersii TaxID=419775 RepID=UPI00221EF346|nr:uncharacterized protein GGS23DRAFT_167051 [Durotheca rogersii]KAI5867231.1 hypothetical protein GGS23DRAFT_167051 [Durotheca rogersii]
MCSAAAAAAVAVAVAVTESADVRRNAGQRNLAYIAAAIGTEREREREREREEGQTKPVPVGEILRLTSSAVARGPYSPEQRMARLVSQLFLCRSPKNKSTADLGGGMALAL